MEADPSIIYAEVSKSLSSTNIQDAGNIIVLGTHNAYFGNRAKAELLSPTYHEFLTRHHLLAWQEVDREFLDCIASSDKRYSFYCTKPNSRGQAVGFTVHDRLQVTGCQIYSQMQEFENLPDLRPALRIDLSDRATGLQMTAVVVHYKSNYGGARSTSAIRYRQAEVQAKVMSNQEFIVSLGDYNQYLDLHKEADPLLQAGYTLLPKHDRAITHASGGRVDGMFVKNMPPHVKITGYRVRNFWKNSKIGCTLSDHALLSWNLIVGQLADWLNL